MRSGTAQARPATARTLDTMKLRDQPGHLLRRAQQRAVDIFTQAVGENGLRPPQFAALLTIHQSPGMSQTQLVEQTGIDRSTIADMIERLAARGYIARRRGIEDQRVNTLSITAQGTAALDACIDSVRAAQNRILAPIPPAERENVMSALALLAELPQEDEKTS